LRVKTYSAEFKAKVVLEILEGEMTLNEIASKYEILPKNLQNWKKQFLENMSLAFDKSTVVKEYKEKIETLQKDKDSMAKKVGELTLEKDFLEGKSPRLNFMNNDTNSNNILKNHCTLAAS
jgi:putative transposase